MLPDELPFLDALSDFVMLTDRDAVCHHVNPAFCSVFGGDRQSWQGKVMGFTRQENEDAGNPCKTSPVTFITSLEKTTGTCWIEWSRSALSEGLFLYSGRDITRHREQEEQLSENVRMAAQASDAKMRFLATMSHEMRTPLNGILGMTGLLLDTGLDANQKAYADAVRESGSALLGLINDILDYSKIEAGKIELEETAFDPQSLVQSVAELLSPRAAHKGLEIASYVDSSVPARLIGDEARLRQVLLNLAGNGVKFTEDGGLIIEIFGLEEPVPGQKNIRIAVRDTGVGISQEAQQQIFEEFAQADSSHARKFEGTGLGLAIARSIVRAMGGDIHVTSEEGKGSVFSFTIPLKVPAGRANQREGENISDHVVVVSQSEIVREALTMQLNMIGVENKYILDDAEEALAILRRHRNTVLICDLNLAAQYGQKLAKASGYALVLLSPVARGRLEAFRRAGFHGYLIKPIRQASLTERLREKSLSSKKVQRLDAIATKPKPGPRKLRILLAEDNQINAVLATAIIKRAGHHVDVAGNGREAVDSIKAAPYDLVLMDMHMPEMDGLEATRQIRALPGDESNKPIIALTANAMKTDRETCLNAGMDDFLTKPFDPADLTGLIDKWADGREAGAEPAAAEG